MKGDLLQSRHRGIGAETPPHGFQRVARCPISIAIEGLMFERYCIERFSEFCGAPPKPDEGLGDDVVRAELARRGLIIPTSLFDYYSLAGRHWINENHDRLRPIEKLELMDDKLVFLDENQEVCFWGIDRSDLERADSVVFPRQDDREGAFRSQIGAN
jgi:hypothetical protein